MSKETRKIANQIAEQFSQTFDGRLEKLVNVIDEALITQSEQVATSVRDQCVKSTKELANARPRFAVPMFAHILVTRLNALTGEQLNESTS